MNNAKDDRPKEKNAQAEPTIELTTKNSRSRGLLSTLGYVVLIAVVFLLWDAIF